jgi:hypothetical protein
MTRDIMPPLEDILGLRSGGMNELDDRHLAKKDAYCFFLDNILECVAGKKEWKKDKLSCKVSKAVTVSDEAFALLLLSNSWEVFEEYATNEKNNNFKRDIKAKAKYTSKRGGSRRFEGWTQEGIALYNKLSQRIVADRNSLMGEQFEIEFMGLMREKYGNKRKRNGEGEDERDENSRPLRAFREDDIEEANGEKSDSEENGNVALHIEKV